MAHHDHLEPFMHSPSALAIAALFCFASSAALAQSDMGKPIKVAAAKLSAKPAASHAQATEAPEAVSANQISIASRVLTGKADCEFSQAVHVEPVPNQPAHFKVGYKDASYTMVPEETTTGAVRLQDKKAGVMWLQIANKSMLMNSKIGQRMVDACTHAEQRTAAAASKGATKTALLQ
jgi:hypothetical protein